MDYLDHTKMIERIAKTNQPIWSNVYQKPIIVEMNSAERITAILYRIATYCIASVENASLKKRDAADYQETTYSF